MAELTLEALAKRIEAIEKELAEQRDRKAREKDWRRVAGMFTGSAFMKLVDAEGRALREAERQAAREGRTE